MYYIMTVKGWRPWLASHTEASNHNQLEGVFKAESLEQIREGLQGRMSRFLRAMENLGPPGNQGPAWNGKHFSEPLYGAFGEKL